MRVCKRICTAPGCARACRGKLCNTHYARKLRHGTFDEPASRRVPVATRFNALWIPEPMSGCWLWEGRINRDGYGTMKISGANVGAHRVSRELHNGPIPSGLLACHKCDNRACVNPAHIYAGTNADNVADMVRRGRCRPRQRRLTEPQVVSILAALSAGTTSNRALAAQYGVAQCTVAQIRQGKMWKHVPRTAVSR